VLGQNAVENNALDRLDGFTPGERSLRDRADKIYQNNQKDKDLYIRAYEAYELKASYLAAKEIVVGRAGHASRALSNDPDAIVILRTVD